MYNLSLLWCCRFIVDNLAQVDLAPILDDYGSEPSSQLSLEILSSLQEAQQKLFE